MGLQQHLKRKNKDTLFSCNMLSRQNHINVVRDRLAFSSKSVQFIQKLNVCFNKQRVGIDKIRSTVFDAFLSIVKGFLFR